MGKKNECYLCGAKLHQGYCRECGLDNTKIKRKNYHLNETGTVTKEQSFSRPKKESKTPKEGSVFKDSVTPLKGGGMPKDNIMAMISWTRKGKTYSGSPALAKGITILCAVVLIISVVFSMISGIKETIYSSYQGVYENPDLESEEYEYEPYAYVTRELASVGEDLTQRLGAGEYRVGTHIPEGKYVITLAEGDGYFSLNDYENAIYIWQSFGENEEYGELLELQDVRLYQNAEFSISEGMVLEFSTDCAQTEAMLYMQNPLTEKITLEKEEEVVVGEAIPAGIYDLSCADDSVWVDYWIPANPEWAEEGYVETCLWLDKTYGSETYCNVVLPEGAKIRAEDGRLTLTPSEKIYLDDYGSYYEYYEYEKSR